MVLVCPNCSSRFRVKPEALGDSGRRVKCAKCAHVWHATRDDLEAMGDAAPPPAANNAPPAAPPQPAPPPPPPEPEQPAEAARPGNGAVAGPVSDSAPEEEAVPDAFEPAGEEPAAEPAETATDAMRDRMDPPPIPREEDFVPRRQPPPERKSPVKAWAILALLVIVVFGGTFLFRTQIVTAYPPANALFLAVGLPVDTLGQGLEIAQPRTEAVIDGETRRLEVEGTVVNTTSEPIEIPLLIGRLMNSDGVPLDSWVFRAEKPDIFPGEEVAYRTVFENPPRGATNFSISFVSEAEAEAEGFDPAAVQ